ncbi:MAG: MASE1 domain-containing protein, partial [Gammaproteobacteria bacterium]|nr:MASE1 domain-containing protein [Gammaproteobacteria bacterium]
MSKFKKNILYSFEIIGIAAIYYFSAKVGQTFAIPPGNITPIWLPSGIMLALMIIRGYRIWPGIFLGAFAGNATSYMDFSEIGSILATVFSGTMNGIGDVICVALAVFLMKRYADSTNLFKDIIAFWQFLLFGVALGPLISALFGVISLTVTGFISVADAPVALLTWWVGDSVGALLITPIILAFYFPTRIISLRTKGIELLVFILILGFISTIELNPKSSYTLITDSVFIMIPLLFWSIFRFGNRITYSTILYFFIISLYLTTTGHSVFSSQIQLFSLLQMQIYFMVVSCGVFIISAIHHEKEEMAGQLSAAISYDPLTNSGSRVSFDQMLDSEIERAKRYDRIFSLVICDLDHFKQVNDHYGHMIGDEILKQFASVIQTNLR